MLVRRLWRSPLAVVLVMPVLALAAVAVTTSPPAGAAPGSTSAGYTSAGSTSASFTSAGSTSASFTSAGGTVTLLTGDRVTLRGAVDGRPGVAITAARRPGRRVQFHTSYGADGVRVLPSDVAHLVPDRLDPRLFEVTALIRAGLHDAATDSLPVIIQSGLRGAGPVRVLRDGRELRSIGAWAGRLAKDRPATAGADLTANGSRIWLDATVTIDAAAATDALATTEAAATAAVTTAPTPEVDAPRGDGGRLDPNLRQVCAPAAWAAGLSGSGVRVAVLDTGVDPTHPDLAGRVAQARDFTGGSDAVDRNGHGTHVAAIIAGSGRGGLPHRRGIAHRATLLAGKVLDDRGNGPFSTIIEGMEWAADQGATVVNLSLSSGAPSTGRDPLSLAVDRISASHGVLFVVSAGNNGPTAGTVSSPGAADSALTVGAVDGRDRIAAFSSRGPRAGDHAIKPELTAPGVDIVSARAAGTEIGDPVGRRYVRASGTSMAAPHVTGAAALLAQLRPQWKAGVLKAALTGSAAPVGLSGFDGGAGRLDLARAIDARLVAENPSVSFGFASFPQAGLPPVTREVRLHNLGRTARTVNLVALMAPRGMLTVHPARLTVPPGGSATATLRLAVARGGFGALAGVLVAGPVRVPVGVVKESTRHLVHVRALDRDGAGEPVQTLLTVLRPGAVADAPRDPVPIVNGAATVRVPPGDYVLTAAIPTLVEGGSGPDRVPVVGSVSIVTVTGVAVHGDVTVLLDARRARPLSARVAGVDTVPVDLHVFVATRDRTGAGFVLGYDTSAQDVREGKLFVAPTTATRRGELELASKWRLDTTDGTATYDVLLRGPTFPPDLAYVVAPQGLARVDTTYRAPVGYREARFVFTDINPVSLAVPQPVPGPTPTRRAEHLAGGGQWFQCATVTVDGAGIGDYCQPPREHPAGTRSTHDWLRAPLRSTLGVSRTALDLLVGMNDLGADGGAGGSIAGHALARRDYALYRDGVLLRSGTDAIGAHPVPAGRARFRLTRRIEPREGLLPVSTVVITEWSFVSGPPRRGQPPTVPAIADAAVHVPVDDRNQVPAGVPLALTVTATGTVHLELSTDDGTHWRRVAVQGSRATVPAGWLAPGGAVSLRTTVSGSDGSRTTQTVIRAFLTAP